MTNEIYFIAALIIGSLVIAVFLFNKKLSEIKEATKPDETLREWLKSQQKSSQSMSRAINERLDNAAHFIAQVSKEVGKMSELGQSMRDLQLFLQSPKLRGNIGEQVLKDLISQAFPKGSFHLQYTFKSGEKVDAVIKTSAGILPIDSKFPMENFRKMAVAESKIDRRTAKKEFVRDIKKHIREISKKYVLPEENTLDFAFMYLPSETVFYEVANNTDLLEYARHHRIYPVSPNTLYVHLQTVLLSFEGQKIEVRSRQVFRMLRALQIDYEKTETALNVLNKHFNNAYHQLNNVLRHFSLFSQKLTSIHALEEENKDV